MTHASEPYRNTLQAIAQNVLNAAGNGSAAMEEGEKGLATLASTIGFLKASRTQALQEIGDLREAIAGLKELFEGSVSSQLDNAISLLNIAKQKVEDYSNNLSRQIQDLETQYLPQVEGDLTNLMSNSGLQLRQAAEEIAWFATNL